MRNQLRYAALCLVAFVVAFWCGPCLGQTNEATVSGIVTDAQNAAIPGASVQMVDTTTGVTTAAKTSDTGFYSIPNLPIGVYNLIVEHEGFQRYSRKQLTLTTEQTLGIDVRLEAGSITQTIQVTGEAPQIATRTSDISQLIDSKSIEDIPLGNRETMNIMSLTAGAVFLGYDADGEPDFSLSGGRSDSQMIWIDGASAQNIRLGVSNMNVDPPIEVVNEIKVLSNNYSAAYGGESGGVILETTRSGGNTFHGSAYEYLRNNLLDAPGYFAPVQNGAKTQPELRYNVFGGTLGGPIRKDKTFFYFGYQGHRLVTGSTTVLTVPTLLQRAGNFSQTYNAAGAVIPIYEPNSNVTSGGKTTRTQFPGNVIPPGQIDPVASAVLNYFPLPNLPPANIAGASNFSANGNLNDITNFYIAKVDQAFNERNRLTVRYYYANITDSLKSVYPNVAADPTHFPLFTNYNIYGDYTRIVSSTAVNDFRFSYSRRYFNNDIGGLNQGYAAKLGLQGLPATAFPNVVVPGFASLGSATQSRVQMPDDQFMFVDDFSMVLGKHSLQVGIEADRSRDREIALPTASGAFTFSPLSTGQPGNAATGSGLASLLTGVPNVYSQALTDLIDRHSWYYAAFFQDDWTVDANLTLNLGLRWDMDTPMTDSNNRMNGFDPTEINPVSHTPGVVKFMGLNGFRTNAYNLPWKDFAPRLGFAWKPFGAPRTVVRAGFGIFFGATFDSADPNTAALGFGSSVTNNSPDNGLTFPFTLRTFPAPPTVQPPLNDSFGAVAVGATATTAVTYFDVNRGSGYVYQYNLGVQHQLTSTISVEAAGLASDGRRLPNANLPIDQIAPNVLSPTQDTQAYRPFPQFSNVTILAPTNGTSHYYAGMVRAEKRFSHGLNFTGSYTWSKFLDDGEGGTGTAGQNPGPYSNLYDRPADYGYSSNDIPHRFSFGAVYELPFGRGRQWLSSNVLGQIAGGWSISTLTLLQSGPPVTVGTQTNNSNSFSAGVQRPNVLHNPRLSNPIVSQWFDVTAFAQPAALTFGNEGVGIIRAAGTISADFALLRNFQLKNTVLQFRGEFFNAPNHTNLKLPGSTFGAAGFGVVSAASPAREIELGGRLSF